MYGEKSVMLREEARAALSKWKTAEKFLNEVSDPALVDFAIYELEAARRKYIYILGKIREEDAKINTAEAGKKSIE